MQCPQCQFHNPQTARFCNNCGLKLEVACTDCGNVNPPHSKFCNICGQDLANLSKFEKTVSEIPGERKYVSVLFADLSDYTSMSDRMDPEDVKEITLRIFREISEIVSRYDGFIEKYVGDAILALFGVPRTHEDDPLRAVRSAWEIVEFVDRVSSQLEGMAGQPLSMHAGIHTGLVVTGHVDMQRGTHGVTGDTINLASRLSSMANPGEILVSRNIYHQTESHFHFKDEGFQEVKGKIEPVQVYKVLSIKERPAVLRRISGSRADMIGRQVEMDQLGEYFRQLQNGEGIICVISGEAGTGKSRLIEEFKAKLDQTQVQWLEGRAYPFSSNSPYFPLIDLINRSFRIKEGDAPEEVRAKVESGIENLIGRRPDIVPYVGSLYALSYPDIEAVSPEYWKARLHSGIHEILLALTQRRPTIICFEDLHWADHSSIELIHSFLSSFTYRALFLCVYRPPFSLFSGSQQEGIGALYQEIRLFNLSPAESRILAESLLGIGEIPLELMRFIQQRVEGNPFYLEEVILSLTESETLVYDETGWRLARPIVGSDIPSTIQGVIAGRIDRLEMAEKRVLQEASVIGKTFLYQIIEKVTEVIEDLEQCLTRLERHDLVRLQAFQPDREYIFKHALIQEVVYNSLLKKERQRLHERIASVVEQSFPDRLSEFFEILSYHFVKCQSINKAVEYLMKSGAKSLGRYALQESHRYYQRAFDLLIDTPDTSPGQEKMFIDLLIHWAYVFYFRGDFKTLVKLLSDHEARAATLEDQATHGMFVAWFGFALYMSGGGDISRKQLLHALEIGKKINHQQLVGYACTWLAWSSWDIGRLADVIFYGERGNEIARSIESDHYLFFKSLAGIGVSCLTTGDVRRSINIGAAILAYGQKHQNIRGKTLGHLCIGISHFVAGDHEKAITSFLTAFETSADPVYSTMCNLLLGASYLLEENIKEAEDALKEALTYSDKFGYGVIRLFTNAYLGVLYVYKGHISHGLEMLESSVRISLKTGRKSIYAHSEHAYGKVYLHLAKRTDPVSFSLSAQDIGFLMKHISSASTTAEKHLNHAIKVSKEIGADGILGQAYLDLGRLHKFKGRKSAALKCLNEAAQIFKHTEAAKYLERTKVTIASL